jgi:hypothetical protein
LLAKAHSTPAATKPENTPRTSRHRAGQRAAFDRDRYLIIRGALPDETAAAFVKHSTGCRSDHIAGEPASGGAIRVHQPLPALDMRSSRTAARSTPLAVPRWKMMLAPIDRLPR